MNLERELELMALELEQRVKAMQECKPDNRHIRTIRRTIYDPLLKQNVTTQEFIAEKIKE